MRPIALVLGSALCALAAAGCGGSDSGEQATSPPPPTQADAPSATSEREQAPAIVGTSLDDEPISLADYRGRPVLVNVWSSW